MIQWSSKSQIQVANSFETSIYKPPLVFEEIRYVVIACGKPMLLVYLNISSILGALQISYFKRNCGFSNRIAQNIMPPIEVENGCEYWFVLFL